MVKCPKCKTNISDKSIEFCPECGTKVRKIEIIKKIIVEKESEKRKSHLGYKISGFLIAVFGYLLLKGTKNTYCYFPTENEKAICGGFILISLICIVGGIILLIIGFSKK